MLLLCMLLLFDFDGVMVNTAKVAYQTLKEIDAEAPASMQEYLTFFRGNIYEKTGLGDPTPQTLDISDPFFRLYTPRVLALAPVEGIAGMLKQLAQKALLDIISSTVSDTIRQYLYKQSLDGVFQHIYGGDVHKSKVVKIRKALEVHNATKEETFFITDTLGDIKEATEVGIRSIAVTWGYHDRKTLAEGAPYAIVETPTELDNVLSGDC